MSIRKFKGKNSTRKSTCTHIRIRDNNDYDTNVEDCIKSIETQYNIDFRSFPQWKEIIQRLHVAATDYKRKIQDSKLRKSIIIDKLYTQATRISPFELTADFARTAKRWENLETERKKRRSSLIQKPDSVPCIVEDLSEGRVSDSGPPNTEVVSEISIRPPSASLQVDVATDSGLDSLPCLPPSIYTNPHKLVSPADSKFSGLQKKCIAIDLASIDSEQKEWLLLNPTASIISSPSEIYIRYNSLEEQCIQFSLTNCTTEYIYIRFTTVMEEVPFKETNIFPATPLRLYPGIGVVFKFVFRLRNQEDFMSGLFFKVGRNIYAHAPIEAFCLPVSSAFKEARSVSVSKIVSIKPTYLWHMKVNGHPTGVLNISVNDPYPYHLHIHKRKYNFVYESIESSISMDEISPNVESVKELTQELDMKSQSKMSSPSAVKSRGKMSSPPSDIKSRGKNSSRSAIDAKSRGKISTPPTARDTKSPSVQQIDLEKVKTLETVSSIIGDVVEFALEAIVFKYTYLYLQPRSKRRVPVYFTKPEHIGKHQYLYDLEFRDPDTEEVVHIKTINVFAEILPHPIQIHPAILDMSQSPIVHGFCQDHFVIINNHKLYPVTIKIKLTTKMNKLFRVIPMETVVPTTSSVNFEVKFCSREFSLPERSDDFAFFTFKIIIIGYKSLYENVPPLFYEVIAPVAGDFKMIYSDKYFKDISD